MGTRYAGRYDIEAVLGEGGMGAVYRASHAFTGAAVALKIMHAGVARSRNAQERFLREAKAPSAVGHPGIVQVSDAGVAEDGTLYLVLELLEGEDLAAAAARGAIDGTLAISIASELLAILDAAHRAGLVHRDIKPENVFIARDAEGATRVRLLDFGITRQVSDTDDKLTQTGTILGTPHYMSPEQARGQAVDARSDLYSVAGTLYYVLTGKPPFVAANYNLLIVQIMTNPAPPIRSVRDDVPADLAAVIDRALAMDPQSRFTSALEMRAALLACDKPSLSPIAIAPDAFGETMASAPGVAGTPIEHPVLTPPPVGVATRPAPAKTPPSATPQGSHAIPPTIAREASAAQTSVGEKKGKAGLVLGLLVAVAVLGAGGGAAIHFAAEGGNRADAGPPPAVVVPAEARGGPDASGPAPEVVAPDIEARIADLERLEREAAARAAEEAQREEEAEAARAEARSRAAMRRAEMAAAERAAAEVARSRCNLRCTQEIGRCRREGGGQGAAAVACHRAWSECTARCRE